MPEDMSNGYEDAAAEYMAARSASGAEVVRKWAASLPRGASVVDVGAGFGEPLTAILIKQSLTVSAIDASPALVAAFRKRFPDTEIACEPTESSAFFGRTFDAALAVGLIFLLPENGQRELIRRISFALKPGGKLLFSAPRQICTWEDVLTGRTSASLGIGEYKRILARNGLRFIGEYADTGGNLYYEAEKA